ncbi:hypothetical protein ACJX0J_022780 [Zea mays]
MSVTVGLIHAFRICSLGIFHESHIHHMTTLSVILQMNSMEIISLVSFHLQVIFMYCPLVILSIQNVSQHAHALPLKKYIFEAVITSIIAILGKLRGDIGNEFYLDKI